MRLLLFCFLGILTLIGTTAVPAAAQVGTVLEIQGPAYIWTARSLDPERDVGTTLRPDDFVAADDGGSLLLDVYGAKVRVGTEGYHIPPPSQARSRDDGGGGDTGGRRYDTGTGAQRKCTILQITGSAYVRQRVQMNPDDRGKVKLYAGDWLRCDTEGWLLIEEYGRRKEINEQMGLYTVPER
jgi:hypothetical protein